VATPEWLAIVNDEIILRLNPTVLTQIEQESRGFVERYDQHENIIYNLNSQELLQVLASSVGLAPLSQGTLIIWTYYTDITGKNITDKNGSISNLPDLNQLPILRTLINIDGDLSQKVCQDILKHDLGDRILKAHSYIVGQISGQFVTAIANYIEVKLRPFTIAAISMVTVFAWCEPLQKFGSKWQLPDVVIGNCWNMIIAAPITILAIWWINSKLPFKLPSLPKFKRNFATIFVQRLGKIILKLLESRILQMVAIAVIAILVLIWLLTTFANLPIDDQLNRVIGNIESDVESYLPIAIISLRKLIVNTLGKMFLRYPFFVKLIFGRFIR